MLLLRQLPWRHLPPLRLLLTLLRLLLKPLLLLQTPPRLLPMLLQLPQLAHRPLLTLLQPLQPMPRLLWTLLQRLLPALLPLRSKAGTDFRACQPCWSLLNQGPRPVHRCGAFLLLPIVLRCLQRLGSSSAAICR